MHYLKVYLLKLSKVPLVFSSRHHYSHGIQKALNKVHNCASTNLRARLACLKFGCLGGETQDSVTGHKPEQDFTLHNERFTACYFSGIPRRHVPLANPVDHQILRENKWGFAKLHMMREFCQLICQVLLSSIHQVCNDHCNLLTESAWELSTWWELWLELISLRSGTLSVDRCFLTLKIDFCKGENGHALQCWFCLWKLFLAWQNGTQKSGRIFACSFDWFLSGE